MATHINRLLLKKTITPYIRQGTVPAKAMTIILDALKSIMEGSVNSQHPLARSWPEGLKERRSSPAYQAFLENISAPIQQFEHASNLKEAARLLQNIVAPLPPR